MMRQRPTTKTQPSTSSETDFAHKLQRSLCTHTYASAYKIKYSNVCMYPNVCELYQAYQVCTSSARVRVVEVSSIASCTQQTGRIKRPRCVLLVGTWSATLLMLYTKDVYVTAGYVHIVYHIRAYTEAIMFRNAMNIDQYTE